MDIVLVVCVFLITFLCAALYKQPVCGKSIELVKNNYAKTFSNRPLFLLLIWCWLTFFSGFRGPFEIDYLNYTYYFESLSYFSFQDLFANIGNSAFGIETLFILFMKIISLFTDEVICFFVITAGLITFFLILGWKNRSNLTWLCVFLYVCTGLYWLSFNLVRLSVASAFAFWSTKYLENSKTWKFALCILFISLIHTSALVMLIFIPLKNFRMDKLLRNKVLVSFSLIVISVVAYFSTDIFVQIGFNTIYSGYDGEYGMQTGLPITSLMRCFMLIIFIIFYIKYMDFNNQTDRLAFNSAICFCIVSFSGIKVEMLSRLAFYFLPYAFLLVSKVLEKIKTNRCIHIFVVVFFVILYYCFASRPEYYFVWQK